MPSAARSWFTNFELPAQLKPWGFHLLGLYALFLLLADMTMAGIWRQGVRLAVRFWHGALSRWASRKTRSVPDQANQSGASDQTELIQVQKSAYRLGLLSIGMPGTLKKAKACAPIFWSMNFWLVVTTLSAIYRCRLLPLGAAMPGSPAVKDPFHYRLGLKNGTSVDGRRLNKLEDYLLPDRCRIEFADQAFYFMAD